MVGQRPVVVYRCPIEAAAPSLSLPMPLGGGYLVTGGTRLSTKAESEGFHSWGCRVTGTTIMPDARLEREAGPYCATVAMITDFDC
jgi:purine nucleoside phosphorylase